MNNDAKNLRKSEIQFLIFSKTFCFVACFCLLFLKEKDKSVKRYFYPIKVQNSVGNAITGQFCVGKMPNINTVKYDLIQCRQIWGFIPNVGMKCEDFHEFWLKVGDFQHELSGHTEYRSKQILFRNALD